MKENLNSDIEGEVIKAEREELVSNTADKLIDENIETFMELAKWKL